MTVKRKTATQPIPLDERDLYARPKLRPYLEAVSARSPEGHPVMGIRDTLEISPGIVWMEPELFYILQFMDGNHTHEEIRAKFLHNFGDFLLWDDYLHLARQLDKNFMLDNQRFQERYHNRVQEFAALSQRPMTCAGGSYPSEAEACAAYFDAEMEKIAGEPAVDLSVPVRALVLPHIDFRIGMSSYMKGYNLLTRSKPSDLYVILGTAHQGLTNPFALTLLDFETPFGPAVTDLELVKKMTDGCGFDCRKDEYIFKNEHSIEFQVVLLKYFAATNFKILPILAGFSPADFNNASSETAEKINSFVSRLKQLLSLYKGRVTIIASVDFAHIGLRYGDQKQPDQSFLAQMEKNDRSLLQALEKCDQSSFQKTILENDNRFRICGYSPLTTLLELLSDRSGHLLYYSSAAMDSQKSTVSFASLYFS